MDKESQSYKVIFDIYKYCKNHWVFFLHSFQCVYVCVGVCIEDATLVFPPTRVVPIDFGSENKGLPSGEGGAGEEGIYRWMMGGGGVQRH